MTNARQEFVEHTKEVKSKIKAVMIEEGYYDCKPKASLKVGYSEQDYNDFLALLDFVYDSGYGGQNLYGTIWYQDGTWSSRGEYDGSEWWEYNKSPKIPKELK